MRKVRTEHGTRVARRIVCTGCGAADTIDFAPRDPSQVLCRRCAFDRYGAIDPDDPAVRVRRIKCSECSREFDAVTKPGDERTPVCGDCRAGILSRQQDRSKSAVRLSDRVVRARPKN